MPLALGWVSVCARAVDERFHADGADGIEEVTCAHARGPARFRHAAAGATPAAAVAVVHAGMRMVGVR